MKKMSVRLLLAVLVAVFAVGSYAEAAPRRVHHRVRHSSRVSSSTTPQSTREARTVRKHRRTAATAKRTVRPHRQSTKPR